MVQASEMFTLEGCASMSDENGNLLFYSNGERIWNRNHTVMPNGAGLNGDNSSTQGVVAVPRPGSTSEYYLFTVDGQLGPDGLQYSKVDMSLNGGLGDVVATEKNIPLRDTVAEKIAVIKNGDNYWVVVLAVPGDTACAYEVSAAGVNTTPVLSNTGIQITASSWWGYLKPNPMGTQLAFVFNAMTDVHLLDFNRNTGEVTGATVFTPSSGGTTLYGLEYAPCGELLYVMGYAANDLKQYDVTLGNGAAIAASEVILGGTDLGGGALQLGPDNRIYVARYNRPFLDVIENPNTYGVGANYNDSAIFLNRLCQYGLPTFVQSYFDVRFNHTFACDGQTVQFTLDSACYDTLMWNFGDPASGAANTADSANPEHLFTDTGFFTVTLIVQRDTLTDTLTQQIYIQPLPFVDLGPDTAICRGEVLRLDVGGYPHNETYLWHDLSTADTFITATDSIIWVEVANVCDSLRDSLLVRIDDTLQFDLGPDTTTCEGSVVTLSTGVSPELVIQWNTSESTPSINVTQTGTYQVNVINACGSLTDQIDVTFEEVDPLDLLPGDTLTCFNDPFTIRRPVIDSISFLWSDSTTGVSYTVDTTEVIWLAAFTDCGVQFDTMNVVFNGEITAELGIDTIICDEDSLLLDVRTPGATYLWSTGDTTGFVYTNNNTTNYIVTITKNTCEKTINQIVESDDFFCDGIDCRIEVVNVMTPNGDGINDLWRAQTDCNIFQYSLSIYNRWGQLVHFSNQAAYGWDGTINGSPAPEGPYFYELTFKDNVVVDVDRQDFRGSFTLLR